MTSTGKKLSLLSLGIFKVRFPYAGNKFALAIAIPAVARGLAELVGFSAHDLVGEHLGHRPDELLHVDDAINESGWEP